jgi:CheY-like chemotaxis protein
MTSEEASRIFNEYEQANSETQRRFGGTGLGLAISKRLAEAMAGKLTVASEKDQGTTFTLALPCAADAKPTIEKPLVGRRYGLWLSPSLSSQHLAKKLEDLGATIVHPGQSTPESCHALICDPVGAQNLLALRHSAAQFSPIPIWILLNPEDRRGLKAVLAEPATGYLIKPVRASSLVSMLTGQDRAVIATSVTGLRDVAAKARASTGEGLRLLLVDDTAVNLLLASTMLRKAKHTVTTSSSGAEALATLEANPGFDAVLLDVEMPRMDGHEVARRIRALGLTDLPILALTGNASPDDVAACLAAGMNGHLAKPFDREDLEDALKKITRNRAA